MEAEIVVITDDVPMGVSAKDAMKHIKLIMLVNDVSLRGLIPGELAKGFGFVQSKASCAFAKTRHLCAGTIIGSGTVSNKFEGGEGKKIEDGGVGYSCIAEIRMIEKIQTGEFITPSRRKV